MEQSRHDVSWLGMAEELAFCFICLVCFWWRGTSQDSFCAETYCLRTIFMAWFSSHPTHMLSLSTCINLYNWKPPEITNFQFFIPAQPLSQAYWTLHELFKLNIPGSNLPFSQTCPSVYLLLVVSLSHTSHSFPVSSLAHMHPLPSLGDSASLCISSCIDFI